MRQTEFYITMHVTKSLIKQEISKEIKSIKLLKILNLILKPFINIASKTSKKEGVAELVKSDGTLTQNDTEKCNTVNNFFSSVFTTEDGREIPEFNMNVNTTLNSIEVSEQDFINIICKINVNKSPGPDNIHPRLLKETGSQIALPLKLIFDRSLSLGEITYV